MLGVGFCCPNLPHKIVHFSIPISPKCTWNALQVRGAQYGHSMQHQQWWREKAAGNSPVARPRPRGGGREAARRQKTLAH